MAQQQTAVFTFGCSKFADNAPGCFWLKSDRIVAVACGDEHTTLLSHGGKLYTFGSNEWGQLGLGHTQTVSKPTRVKSLKAHKIKLIACGRNHTILCTTENKIFAFGNNSDAQLGTGNTENSTAPVEINTNIESSIKQLAAGADFSAALTENGELYVWGSNAEGQLGLGSDLNEVTVPTRLNIDIHCTSVSCGYYHTAVLSKSGNLYTFGEDEHGKLAVREKKDTYLPGKVVVPQGINVERVACGGSHTAFISTEGKLYVCGNGMHGELGLSANMLQADNPMLVNGLSEKRISHVSCGENFTCAVTDDGDLYTFGDGRHGKLGLEEENYTNHFVPRFCERFRQLKVYSAVCGGRHLMVLASVVAQNTEQDLSQSIVSMNVFSSPEKPISDENEPESTLGGSSLSRSKSARDKRREHRETLTRRTLPPLKTLKPYELEEAAKTLPLPKTTSDIQNWERPQTIGAPQKHDDDEVSTVSTLNKVHVLTSDAGETSFKPVKPKRGTQMVNGIGSEKVETEKATVNPEDIPDMEEPSEEESGDEDEEEGEEEEDEGEESGDEEEEEENGTTEKEQVETKPKKQVETKPKKQDKETAKADKTSPDVSKNPEPKSAEGTSGTENAPSGENQPKDSQENKTENPSAEPESSGKSASDPKQNPPTKKARSKLCTIL